GEYVPTLLCYRQKVVYVRDSVVVFDEDNDLAVPQLEDDRLAIVERLAVALARLAVDDDHGAVAVGEELLGLDGVAPVAELGQLPVEAEDGVEAVVVAAYQAGAEHVVDGVGRDELAQRRDVALPECFVPALHQRDA